MYIVFDREDGEYLFFNHFDDAKMAAHSIINQYRIDAQDNGWPELLEDKVGVAKVMLRPIKYTQAIRDDYTDDEWQEEGYSSDYDEICDYQLGDV